jgi:putative transposase
MIATIKLKEVTASDLFRRLNSYSKQHALYRALKAFGQIPKSLLRTAMTELDVEIVLQRARERYSGTFPRIIADNGPQFIAKDFKEFIRLAGLTHVKISPYYPQSNGKIERLHQSLKVDCLRPGCPLSQQDGTRLIEHFVNHYNTVRLHSAIGYVAPADRLAGRHLEILVERDRKLELARQNRKTKRQSLAKCHCFE